MHCNLVKTKLGCVDCVDGFSGESRTQLYNAVDSVLMGQVGKDGGE